MCERLELAAASLEPELPVAGQREVRTENGEVTWGEPPGREAERPDLLAGQRGEHAEVVDLCRLPRAVEQEEMEVVVAARAGSTTRLTSSGPSWAIVA